MSNSAEAYAKGVGQTQTLIQMKSASPEWSGLQVPFVAGKRFFILSPPMLSTTNQRFLPEFFRIFVRLEKMAGDFFPATLWVVKTQPVLRSAGGYLHQLDRWWRFETRRVSKMQKGLFLSARQTRLPQNRIALCPEFESRTTVFLTAPPGSAKFKKALVLIINDL